jgi:hypothetical protein
MNSFFIYLLNREESILDKGRRMSIDLELNNKMEIWYRSFGLKKYGLELK